MAHDHDGWYKGPCLFLSPFVPQLLWSLRVRTRCFVTRILASRSGDVLHLDLSFGPCIKAQPFYLPSQIWSTWRKYLEHWGSLHPELWLSNEARALLSHIAVVSSSPEHMESHHCLSMTSDAPLCLFSTLCWNQEWIPFPLLYLEYWSIKHVVFLSSSDFWMETLAWDLWGPTRCLFPGLLRVSGF